MAPEPLICRFLKQFENAEKGPLGGQEGSSSGGEMGGPTYLSLGQAKLAPTSPAHARRQGGGARARKEGKEFKLSTLLRQCPSAVEPNKISVVEKYITQVPSLRPAPVQEPASCCGACFCGSRAAVPLLGALAPPLTGWRARLRSTRFRTASWTRRSSS